ncbi:MAG: translocation/assembly module TamB domain-containing protein [Prevotella sp.]|nr:translocation/assembly module TamB domain-containing protein [Prevotella sp.]
MKIKHIINGLIWTVIGLYLLLLVLFHIPAVQRFIGSKVSIALSEKLGTKVNIGRIDLGFLNRIIIDDMTIQDQQNKKMISAARLSAKFNLVSLSQGNISISSIQLFGFNGVFYKKNAASNANYQFVLDSLASKDKTKSKPLNLKINSIIIRHGAVRYDRYDIPELNNKFSLAHINTSGISANIRLRAFTEDSLNLNIKKLTFRDQSGLNIDKLSLKLNANKKMANLTGFVLNLPGSSIRISNANATYRYNNKKIIPASLQFNLLLDNSKITPSDFKCFVPQLKSFNSIINVALSVYGTRSQIRIKKLAVNSHSGDIYLRADGSVSDWDIAPKWFANINNLSVSGKTISFISKNLNGINIKVPTIVNRLGNVKLQGIIGGTDKTFATKSLIATSVGKAHLALGVRDNCFTGRVETAGINLKALLDNKHFGTIATNINIDGNLKDKKYPYIKAKGDIIHFDYNGYAYSNIKVDGIYRYGIFNGMLGMNDANGLINVKGLFSTKANHPKFNLTASIKNFNPYALKITDKLGNAIFDVNISANFNGNNINNLKGTLDIENFSMQKGDVEYKMDAMHIIAGCIGKEHFINMNSDFAKMNIQGQYDYATLAQSITNFVGSKLPTLPGLPKTNNKHNNNFKIDATITRSDWLNKLFNIPIELNEPFSLVGEMNDRKRTLNISGEAPKFSYKGNNYQDGMLSISTPNDTLKCSAKIKKVMGNGHKFDLTLNANAINNLLATSIGWTNNLKHLYSGSINTQTQFFRNEKGESAAQVSFHPSQIIINDTAWNVEPSAIVYSKSRLIIDHFAIERGKQHLIASGIASPNQHDSIFVDLKDINVDYILNLVNFHSVEFGGQATGSAYISSAFSNPSANATLTVNNFTFEEGRMGTLFANVNWNKKNKQIDIDAKADDGPLAQTLIKGNVSPARNTIDLGISARGTNVEFMKTFCGSFMNNIDAQANGDLRLVGPLNTIQLIGQLTVDGQLSIRQLGTTYTLKSDTIRMIPDEIEMRHVPFYDHNNNVGYITGNIHHKHLTKLSYDLAIKTNNLLAYDHKTFGDNTFCGTVYGTGDVNIHGKSGEVTIDMNVTPNKNSIFIYNTASAGSVSDQQFIHWNEHKLDKDISNKNDKQEKDEEQLSDMPTNIYLNFLINCNQNATLKVIMDNKTNDYIAMNGDGVIRATYYNKGAFDMFGTYNVDHGIYKLTIQNVIKKDFQFQQGSSIVFGGDPYDASLNLKAQYVVNGVSLSDLSIGKSFSNNTIRVNCLMNITGQPRSPKVDFDLDLPTVNADEKQMVRSIINSQEDMNQQVLYLLGIGRFYTQGVNNAATEEANQKNQTSLAMQSLLSGTISSQINTVLSSVLNNNNWNFGANISTGTEGWNNAEYEGLMSGRLLNNRLLINGQFGYRDNATTANTSFIGDFDIRYLLYPNGNLAIKVYNQTNDRYFTKSSMNTQGLGLIMKKDFNGLKDLFGRKKNKIKKNYNK